MDCIQTTLFLDTIEQLRIKHPSVEFIVETMDCCKPDFYITLRRGDVEYSFRTLGYSFTYNMKRLFCNEVIDGELL